MGYFGPRCRPVPLWIWAWPLTFPGVGKFSGSEPAPWGPVRSGSAAVCAGLRCLLLVVIVSRPGLDARFFFVLRKRFLNLAGRGRAADQTIASETLVPLRPESGIPDRLTSDECVLPCVGSQPVFPPLQGVWVPGRCTRRGRYLGSHGRVRRVRGLRWLKVFAPRRRSPIFLFLVD